MANNNTNIAALNGLEEHGFGNRTYFDASLFSNERIDAIREIIRIYLYPIKNVSYMEHAHSYRLKHIIEQYAYATNHPLLGNYITNGECIYAMYLEGYKVKQANDEKNAYFNVSKRSVEELLRRIND